MLRQKISILLFGLFLFPLSGMLQPLTPTPLSQTVAAESRLMQITGTLTGTGSLTGTGTLQPETAHVYLPLIFKNYTPPRYTAETLYKIAALGQANLAEKCNWEAGVLAFGWAEAWTATNDTRYLNWLQNWVSACIEEKQTLHHVNDGLYGYAALILYEATSEAIYLSEAERVADYLLYQAPRTTEMALTHDEGRLWVDTLLGAVPFLLKMGEVTGEDVYTAEAVRQALLHADSLQNADGLYRHASDPQNTGLGQIAWGRGNGWTVLAQVHLLRSLPENHADYATLLNNYQRQMAAVARLQNNQGLWSTLLKDASTYTELSGSTLLAYGFVVGVEAGWLEASYSTQRDLVQAGIAEYLAPDGQLEQVSNPTWPMLPAEYAALPVGNLQLYGQGIALIFVSGLALPS